MPKLEAAPLDAWKIEEIRKREERERKIREQQDRDRPHAPDPNGESIPENDPERQPPPAEKPHKIIKINPDGTTEES